MANFSSTFRALTHGTLNWDTQLDADLLDLEGRLTDTGWITGGTGITAATGFTLTSARYRQRGGVVSIGVVLVRTGATITASAAGLVTATNVATLPASLIPATTNGSWSATGTASTVMAHGYVSQGASALVLTNVAPSQSLVTTTGTLDLMGTYLL